MGVPLETILGPLLYILYVIHLLKKINKVVFISYADDTVIIFAEDIWTAASNKINRFHST